MKKYLFTWTYKEDEAFMRNMIHVGSGAVKADFGQWEFEVCSCDQYCYRMAFVYGMKPSQLQEYKQQLKHNGIELVNSNRYFAITRSNEPFKLYTVDEEIEICQTVKRKMSLYGYIMSMLFIASLMLTFSVNQWFIFLNIIIYFIAYVFIKFTLSYNLLEKKLKRNDKDVLI